VIVLLLTLPSGPLFTAWIPTVAVEGTIVNATDRAGEGDRFDGRLAPWAGVVVSG